MTNNDPYTAPQAQPTPQQVQGMQQPIRSSVPKVFGILHIIYGGFGIISSALAPFASKTIKFNGLENNEQLKQLVENFAESTKMITYADAVVRFGLSVLIIMAGIQLLKYKKKGVQMTKIFYIIRIIALVAVTVAMRSHLVDYMDNISKLLNSPNILPSLPVQLIIGILMASIYPVIALIMLTRKNVQNDLS